MMRKLITLSLTFVVFSAFGAIIFYTSKPNAIPVGSDFFSLQRNTDYINASVNQFSNMLFFNPTFGGVMTGNGGGLFNVPGVNGGFILSASGFGTNTGFYGPTTFFGTNNYGKLEIFDNNSIYVAGFDTNKGGFWGFGNLSGFTNLAFTSILPFSSSALFTKLTDYNGANWTNSGYSLPTNNVGGGNFVFGGPGTAATLYDTNITTATTLKLFDITACGATAGGMKIYVTCSGGTDRILTFPAGCSGAGLGTPPAVTITNTKAAFFDVIYKPGATPVTNVFWSPVY